MTDENQIHDLDEMLGVAQPIKVRIHGVIYELRNPNALPPEDILRWFNLYDRIETATQSAPDTLTEESMETLARQIEDLVDVMRECLDLMCPKLAKAGLSFLQQLKVIDFYARQFEPVEEDESKNQEAA